MALTDSWLKNNNGKLVHKEYEKADRDGLSVRVSPKGKLTFQYRYRYHGKPKRFSIGSYPDVSLKEAREKLRDYRNDLAGGLDPGKVVKARKVALAKRDDIDSLWTAFYNAHLNGRIDNPRQHQRSYEIHIKPKFGKILADDISIASWADHLKTIADKTPSIADRLLTDLRRMYHYGVRYKDVKTNPLADISASYDLNIKKGEGKRVLNDDEIRLVLEAVKYTRNHSAIKTMFRLCLFFGCRVGELRLAERSHFKDGLWTVPYENHKTGEKIRRDLVRAVNPSVMPEIEKQGLISGHKALIFTRPDGVTPLQERAHLDIPYSLMNWIERQHDIKIPHFSVHDLRRTARTFFSGVVEPHVAEIMLGHSLPKIWRTYDLYYYLKEQREAYALWLDKLRSLGF